MKKLLPLLLLVATVLLSEAQEKLSYFLPDDVSYNEKIPTPEDFFHQQMGEWHLSHDQLLSYVKEIARLSARAIFYEYARSYENRPLVHLVFTSKENQQNLDQLKERHYQYSEPGSPTAKEDVPLVVSLTYAVHGNESSGGNASVLTAYYLAAAEGEKIDQLLKNTIVIVDPCLNPDGFTRHSTWANMHQSSVANGDSYSRQFDEVWPGGRSNHYWFDLNRDYLLLVHPESRGRVEKFHEWKPNIVTDHHEMGANSTFFFQPGVPSRNNPLTPERNYELTHEIAQFHAKYLDKIGTPYFSEEQFDDYYFGKGSSYPDINGSIGILFEQAGFRGRVRETSNGIRKLAYGIRNQFTVSLSTLDAAMNLHDELLDMQKDFYNDALKLGKQSKTKAYIFGSETDKVKTQLFVDLLNRHQIKVYANTKDATIDGKEFKEGSSFVVPAEQKQYRLLTSIFEEVHDFSDTTFYDVSTWTFTHAYGLQSASLSSLAGISLSNDPVKAHQPEGKIIGSSQPVAYVFRWNEYSAPKALYQLQAAGLTTKVATGEFMFPVDNKDEKFENGTILVSVYDQPKSPDQIKSLVASVAQNSGIDFYALPSGLSPQGIDLGSNSFEKLLRPQILLFVGGSTSSLDAGEIWHMFDQRFQIPLTLTETENLGRMDLIRYNTIILAGNFSEWNEADAAKLKDWISNGGTLIACENASEWASRMKLGAVTFKKQVEPDKTRYLKYNERGKERNLNYISGAIFQAQMDLSHPLCYGYTENKLPVFKSTTLVANTLDKKYAEPVQFTSSPYLSGWVSEENLERIANAPVVSVQPIGRGRLISYYDNMNFRGTWLGTTKLFTNSVFFGNIIR